MPGIYIIIKKNSLTQDQIDKFRDYWNSNEEDHYTNFELDGKVLDRRLAVEDINLIDIIKDIIKENFTNYSDIAIMLQRQNFAHNIHIDDYMCKSKRNRYTYVFALDTVPEFKTIVWKNRCNSNTDLEKYIKIWQLKKSKLEKVSNISSSEDLEHTYDNHANDYLADYLNLDGIFTYQAGSGVLFRADSMHCTSNWIKYKKFPHRDLLQVHLLSDDDLDL